MTLKSKNLNESFCSDLLNSEVQLPLPGSLITILSELFWYDRRSLHEKPEQIYFVVESVLDSDALLGCEAETLNAGSSSWSKVLKMNLVIDGSPTWVEVDENDYNLLCV